MIKLFLIETKSALPKKFTIRTAILAGLVSKNEILFLFETKSALPKKIRYPDRDFP